MLNRKFLSTASVVLVVGLLVPNRSDAFDINWLDTADFYDISDMGRQYVSSSDSSVIYGNAYEMVGSVTSQLSGIEKAYTFSRGSTLPTLGTGDNASRAYSISVIKNRRDVIAGYSYNDSGFKHAVVWAGDGACFDLGTLGHNNSEARGATENDSNVGKFIVVGTSMNTFTGSAFVTTFDWATGTPGTMRSLDPMNASKASGISLDGTVIIGTFYHGTDGLAMAITYDPASDNFGSIINLDDVVVPNIYNYSEALGVSGDGGVIVGKHRNAPNAPQTAFAITFNKLSGTHGVICDLGTLNSDNRSWANGVLSDGTVVVGGSSNGTLTRAFAVTYDSATNSHGTMIELPSLGSTLNNNTEAFYVEEDGGIEIYGYSENDDSIKHATKWFLIAGSAPQVYMVDVTEWMQSISGPAGIMPMVNSLTSLPMEGAHHRPLMSLDSMGKKSQSWVTGDFGERSRTSDSHTTSGEAGVSSTFGRVMAGLAVGYSEQNNDLLFGGSSNISGQYILGDVDMRLSDNKSIVSVTAMLGNWKSKTLRGYGIQNGLTDYSLGSTNLNSTSVRLRIDGAPHKLIRGPSITPFASFTWSRTTADAYNESGGSFDAQFNKQSHVSKEGRIGLSTHFKLGKDTTLLTTLEWIHRFDKSESGFSGTDIDHGALPFSVSGSAIRSNQARLGFDVDHKLNRTTMLNFSAHVTSVGEAPDVSTALSLRHAF